MREEYIRAGLIIPDSRPVNPPHERREILPRQVKLATNPQLLDLAERIKTTRPDWPLLIDELLERTEVSMTERTIIGRLAEIHIELVLAEQARHQPGAIVLDPIPERARSDHFNFHRARSGPMNVYWNDNGYMLTDYDLLTMVAGLPTVWEVKSSIRTDNIASGAPLGTMFRQDEIYRKFLPLAELYDRTDVGYVMVLAKEVEERRQGRPALARDDFQERGGVITHLPFYHDELVAAAARAYAAMYG